MAKKTKTDEILDGVIASLGLSKTQPKICYQNLTAINAALDKINAKNTINVKTTGTINERLVQFALDGFVSNSWYPLTYKKF